MDMLQTEKYMREAAELRTQLRNKVLDAMDVNYAVAQIPIDTPEAFEAQLHAPFREGTQIFYRGERIYTEKRRLIPTLLRCETLLDDAHHKPIVRLDSQALLQFYREKPCFSAVYETLYGAPDVENLYRMLAFAQHYLDVSPFIDFTKSLYVALSFALKGRTTFEKDIVLYTAFDIGENDTSTDEAEANRWLADYHVNLLRPDSKEDLRRALGELRRANPRPLHLLQPDFLHAEELLESFSPQAKLIDIPTNDLMKYQQGVFLLLNHFNLFGNGYLTKSVRQSFTINKYVIHRSVCPYLQKLLVQNAPQYRYECLLDIAKAVRDNT